MDDNRRSFIQSGLAGAAGMAGVSLLTSQATGAVPAKPAVAGLAATSVKAEKRHPQPLPTGMTFATLRKAHGHSLGIRDGERVLDVAAAEARFKLGAPISIDAVLQGEGDLGALPALLTKARSADAGLFLAAADAAFGPCVTDPEKIICVGLNYRAHVAEASLKQSTVPILFNKYNSALNHHRGEIAVSKEKVARKFDYEGELVVVMGRTARDVSEADALSYVFGYCTGNDFSARDLQLETSQWMEGKTGDGWGPIGPWLVTADQVDPANLDLETRVNGEVRQSANTGDMIFDCKTLVSFASHRMTLRPGDLIFTGTPQGVILGYPPEKQVWLKAGDRITTRIGNLGQLDFTLT
jgi:2-keto-4-pentenoate hydratase/2-oxohepta-3-ene-1,7-dioic acid hydratase in catechol pathway